MNKLEIWEKEQNSLISKLQHQENIKLSSVKTICGMDCLYWDYEDKHLGVCSYQIFDYFNGNILEENSIVMEVNEPYIVGFLYFKEKDLMEKAFHSMKIKPDIICCDGNGILHPRYMGEATHFGIVNNIPTIGIAKNLYKFENLEEMDNDLYYNNNLVGNKLFLNENSNTPCYISTGYNINLNDAILIVKHMQKLQKIKSKYSIITKGADSLTRQIKKQYFNSIIY